MKKLNVLLLLSLSIIILSSSIVLSDSQTIDPATYNGSYKVKIGDSNRYDVLKIQNQSNDYITSSGPLSNGTYVSYNLTKGDYITFVVTTINMSSTGATTIYGNESIFVHGHQPFQMQSMASGLVNPGFNTFTDAKSYYNSTFSGSNTTFTRHGDIISYSPVFYSPPASNSSTHTEFIEGFNWRTGWLESIFIKSYFTNGTVLVEESLQRHSAPTLIGSITNISTNALEIGSIGLIIAIPVLIGFSYTKFSQASKNLSNSQSFPQYLSSKVRYSKKNPKKQPIHSADKALETIESILEETGGSK